MTETTTFDKNGIAIETMEAKLAEPFEIFKTDKKINSLRIKFFGNGRVINQLTFYRVDFKV